MILRRVGLLSAAMLSMILWAACGQVYRPVVLPCSVGGLPNCPVETPPAPANFHEVFAVTHNVPNYPGTAVQIDVGGDAIIGETPSSDLSAPNLGTNPTFAAILPTFSQVWVTSAGSVVAGGIDQLSSFVPAAQSITATGLGPVQNIPLTTGSQPVFAGTTQSGALYLANFGTNSVSVVSTNSAAVVNTTTVGTNPVALAELPNALKLYVANQGSNSVSSLNPTDFSANILTGFTGMTPVWVVARNDSQKVYVLTQGDGQLVTIDTATDTVTSSLPVGVGAKYIYYDPNLNRLYVPNPVNDILYVFSVSGGANDTPALLKTIAFTGAAGGACTAGCSPESVAALSDGTRFYVATYQIAAACPDPFVGAKSACVIPQLFVYNAANFTLETTLTLLTDPPFAANVASNQYQYAVAPVATCAPAVAPALYSPSTARFRVFTVASTDATRVYASICDAGVIAVINTTDSNTNNPNQSPTTADTVVTDLPAPFAGPTQANGASPSQTPLLLITGQ